MTIGRIRWEMSLIWSDNWKRWQVSNIRLDGIIFSKETGDTHWTTNCLRQLFVYPLVLFYWDWKKDTCVWARFLTGETHWSCMRMIIGRIRWKMSLIWSDNWKRWQWSNIRLDGMILWKETGDTHWTKKKPIEKQRRIEYKSDNFVVRHSFFENKMCDVRDNPRWALSHVDDMLDILENHVDECTKDNLTSSWKKQWDNSFKA